MGLVDSHCHINFPGLGTDLDGLMERMAAAGVDQALCVSVSLETLPEVLQIAERYPNVYASVGVHPNHTEGREPTDAGLVDLARHPRVIAIGETGLDYYRVSGDLEWQRERFRCHIRAARRARKPLIVHMREAAVDTIRVMQEEGATEVGGVMHCFTETWEVAQSAMAMNFLISFSGILTFRNAQALREVAKKVPLERILIETDSPYLAPMPHRGETNQPAFVRFVGEELARVKGITFDEVVAATGANFEALFCPPVTQAARI